MQVLERAVRMMKAPAGEGVRNRVDSADIPVSDFPDVDFDKPAEIDPPVQGERPAAPLIRARRRDGFAELPDEDDGVQAAPMFAAEAAEPDEEGRPQFGPLLTWFGAAASIALIVGVSVWTYKLGQRDAMDVPIIAAMEGPARIAPDTPGGAQMAHQGLSVNAVLEGGGVAEVASSVTVQPSVEGLTEEDAPQAALAAIAAARKPEMRPDTQEAILGETMATVMMIHEMAPEAGEDTELAAQPLVQPVEDAAEDVAALVTDEEAAAAVADALALARSGGVQPETTVVPAPEEATEVAAATVDEPVTEDAPLVEQAPMEVAALGPVPPRGQGSAYAPAMLVTPKARPADLGADMAAAVDAAIASVLGAAPAPEPAVETPSEATQVAAVEAPSDDLSTIPLPPTARLIQLGAFDSEAVARRQWEQISARHGDLLGGKEYYVQKIDRSGRIFYRLRVAGYANKQETQAACAALTARGLPCMPTINR